MKIPTNKMAMKMKVREEIKSLQKNLIERHKLLYSKKRKKKKEKRNM